jgi:hypothetical protein
MILVLGHPFRGTHNKMNRSREQEIRELTRLKHHSHESKTNVFAQSSLFSHQGFIFILAA